MRRTKPHSAVGWRRLYPTAFALLDLWAAPHSGKLLRFMAHRLASLETWGINHGIVDKEERVL